MMAIALLENLLMLYEEFGGMKTMFSRITMSEP
jgi:hypothetical protein